MSEQQVLPPMDVIPSDYDYERVKRVAEDLRWDSKMDMQNAVNIATNESASTNCRERQLLAALTSLAQSEAERERLQEELVSAKAGESMQAGHLWKAYQASDCHNAMTFSGWINWNIIERGKAEAELARLERVGGVQYRLEQTLRRERDEVEIELARERELNQGLHQRGFNDCREKAMRIVDEHGGFLSRIEDLKP